MKQSDIKVGSVYRNRGAGTTHRKVTGIGLAFRPDHRFSSKPADTMDYGVEYQQKLPNSAGMGSTMRWSEPRRMWLDSFASWAGSEVVE